MIGELELNFSDPNIVLPRLIGEIERDKIVPIIGRDLLVTGPGNPPRLLYHDIAQKMADAMGGGLAVAESHGDELNELANQYRQRSANMSRFRDYVHQAVDALDRKLPVPTPLIQLASIPFGLYVTTTFDGMLVRALRESRHIEADENIFAFSPEGFTRDLPISDAQRPNPSVFHLFGRHSASPSDYAVTDADILEFLYSIQGGSSPEKLLHVLAEKELLFIGCSFSDWLVRFLIRTARGEPLSIGGQTHFFADERVKGDQKLVTFLLNFSQETEVLKVDAVSFVRLLFDKWNEKHPSGRDTIITGNGGEQGEVGVFVSYASEDRHIVYKLKGALERQGLEVWFDQEDLHEGDDWEAKIFQSIERAALFVPIISENTLTKDKRFFREEWVEAAKVVRKVGKSRKYIIPLQVGDVSPDEPDLVDFKKYQYLRWVESSVDELARKLKTAATS